MKKIIVQYQILTPSDLLLLFIL